MTFCITDKSGQKHCYDIPIIVWPVKRFPPPKPHNYEGLVWDLTILTSIADIAKQISDGNVRKALEAGLSASVQAAQAHAGKDVTINLQTARE
jgi:hypothetical protein